MNKQNILIKSLVAVLLTALAFNGISAQQLNPNKVTYPSYSARHRSNFVFPPVSGYKVLTCDFHTHTVFSDGLVWPTLRVEEAWAQGLDVLAITDHIEYRPYRKYTNNDHNTSYLIAKPAAEQTGIMLVRGTEITRTQRTIGHYNALFIKDANAIDKEDPKESILEAKRQGAFIMWNHPGWAVDSTYIKEFQADLFNEGIIDGIEVFNNTEFYPRVLSWAVDMNLAILATTDVHGNVESGTLMQNGVERPMTLVLSKESSPEGVREALDARRTLAFFQGMLAAREDIAKLFVESNLTLTRLGGDEKSVNISIKNLGSVPYEMLIDNKLHYLPKLSSIVVTLPESGSKRVSVKFNNIFIYEDKTLAHDLYFN